jgi:hypothetical protein
MSEPRADTQPTTVSGACLCKAIRFEVSLPTLFCGHCHCSICRRSHGAAFVTWFGVPREQLRLLPGSDEPACYRSSEHGSRSFCARCGSSLFCESAKHPGQIDIVLANMDGPIDRAPQAHVYFSDRVAWHAVGDDLPRLGGASGFEALDGDG